MGHGGDNDVDDEHAADADDFDGADVEGDDDEEESDDADDDGDDDDDGDSCC